MFKRTSVIRRNLVGKDGGSGFEVKGVYKKNMILKGGGGTQISERIKVTIRTLREESERSIFSMYHWPPRAILCLNICTRTL